MLRSTRSPSTMILSATRLPKASRVARSVNVYARRSSARPSVAPMPWPDSMYQGAAGTTPACFQSASSSVWVPDLSPRETNRAPAPAIRLSAATTLLSPAGGASDNTRAAISRYPSITALPCCSVAHDIYSAGIAAVPPNPKGPGGNFHGRGTQGRRHLQGHPPHRRRPGDQARAARTRLHRGGHEPPGRAPERREGQGAHPELRAVARHPRVRQRDAAVQPGGGQARARDRGVDDQHGPAVRPEALVRRGRGQQREDPVRLP